MTKLELLLIENGTELCTMMVEYFGQLGHDLECAYTGANGLERALSGNHDLVLLDVMLPLLNGLSVLQQLRRRKSVPVILLTARTHRDDRIEGLEKGADDYVTKPFDPDELLARIRAILRRTPAGEQPLNVQVGALLFDAGRREVQVEGQTIALTSLEFDILEMLLRSAGRIVSRQQMSQTLLERELSPFDRALDVHVSRLRSKLGQCRNSIHTIRGSGYVFHAGEAGA